MTCPLKGALLEIVKDDERMVQDANLREHPKMPGGSWDTQTQVADNLHSVKNVLVMASGYNMIKTLPYCYHDLTAPHPSFFCLSLVPLHTYPASFRIWSAAPWTR